MLVEQKLRQIEQLVTEIREELTQQVKSEPLPVNLNIPSWIKEKLRKVPMGKPYKTSQLYSLMSPTETELAMIRQTGVYSGNGEILFGKLLSKIAGEDVGGITLVRGMTDGCTTYRLVPSGGFK